MIIIVSVLILMSAVFSGLTIGMFSLSVSGLERKIRLGDKMAARVYKVRKDGNYLLCTLLLGNVAVNQAIGIVMSGLSSGVWAGVISTVLIFIFGEVTPQAVFSRHALTVGYYTSWLVRTFMILMSPLAKPMAWVLDKTLGKEFPERFSKSELKELIADHDGGTIDNDERRIMMGAMKFSEKTAQDVITPATILFHLDEDVIITEATLKRIKHEHYSRIPVHSGSRDKIVGILYAKDLIGFNVHDLNNGSKTVGDLCKRDGLLYIRETMHLDSLMNHFLKNKTHMAFVYNEFNILQGIVTLEDIMEEVLDIEILDESDTVADLQKLAAKKNNQINLQE